MTTGCFFPRPPGNNFVSWIDILNNAGGIGYQNPFSCLLDNGIQLVKFCRRIFMTAYITNNMYPTGSLLLRYFITDDFIPAFAPGKLNFRFAIAKRILKHGSSHRTEEEIRQLSGQN